VKSLGISKSVASAGPSVRTFPRSVRNVNAPAAPGAGGSVAGGLLRAGLRDPRRSLRRGGHRPAVRLRQARRHDDRLRRANRPADDRVGIPDRDAAEREETCSFLLRLMRSQRAPCDSNLSQWILSISVNMRRKLSDYRDWSAKFIRLRQSCIDHSFTSRRHVRTMATAAKMTAYTRATNSVCVPSTLTRGVSPIELALILEGKSTAGITFRFGPRK